MDIVTWKNDVLESLSHICIYIFTQYGSGGNNSDVLGKMNMFADDLNFSFWLGNKDVENGK